MIRINLLGRRKARRRGAAAAPSHTSLLVGLSAGVLVAAAAGFFLLHRPLSRDLSELRAKIATLEAQNEPLRQKTRNSRPIRASFEAALARHRATARLKRARVSPAWLMRELSSILTPGRQPQLTPEMQEEMKTNPNRPWQEGWDPRHVWMTSFEERAGEFRLQGGAQSRTDIDELGLRLRASMFFGHGLKPAATSDEVDKETGLTYYKFTIEGVVRY